MCEHHLDYLPVVDENMRVMGIVALKDLAAKKRQRRNQIASGAKQERTERKKVLALAQAHKVDVILVTELTRSGLLGQVRRAVLNVL